MIDEYLKAKRAGEREYRKRSSEGEYPYLAALDDICPDCSTLAHKSLGIIEIPVDMIAGTKTRARQNSFSAGFMPVLEQDTEFAIKWTALYRTQLSEGFNDPIKAYEYLHRFYVQEGNKRASVCKYLEMPTISAEVIRVMPESEVLDEHPEYKAFLKFFEVSGIYDIECSGPGQYMEIAELLGEDLENRWPEHKIASLKAAYWVFAETFKKIQGKEVHLLTGDAFLVYLRIYVKDALGNYSFKVMEKRISKIKKELLKEGSSEKVELVENADEALNAGNIFSKTGSAVGKALATPVSKVIPALSYSQKNPLKAAFIYDKESSRSNWVSDHERGRLRLEQSYGGSVVTRCYENCDSPALFEEAAARAADWGADVVFTTSPRQINDALRAAIEYENIKFLNCSINLAHQAVRTYYVKLYEAKFLAGLVAGTYSALDGTHKIGYCSNYPIYGTVAGINAFAIGAAMTDPSARIYLDWYSREGNNWWWSMLDKGIHVISAVDSRHNTDGSDAYGLCYVDKCEPGTGNDLSGTCRIKNLAAPIMKWGKLYEIIVQTIMDGSYNARPVDIRDRATNYWWGMISGVVDIKLSDELPLYTGKLVRVLKQDIINGSFNPFDTELRSQEGIVRTENDSRLESRDIIQMDWLNENIVGEIPAMDALTDEAKTTVKYSGVEKSKGGIV